MTCSRGTKRSPSGMTTKRGQHRRDLHPGEAALVGDRVAHGDGQVERQVGDVGERVARVDGEGGEHREDAVLEHARPCAGGRRRRAPPTTTARCRGSASSGATCSRNRRSSRSTSTRARAASSRTWAVGERPSGARRRMPAATWSSRPATRTWKNSSRFWLKMARNLARSSSGIERVVGQGQDPLVEVEPRQLAVEEAVGVLAQRPAAGARPRALEGATATTWGPILPVAADPRPTGSVADRCPGGGRRGGRGGSGPVRRAGRRRPPRRRRRGRRARRARPGPRPAGRRTRPPRGPPARGPACRPRRRPRPRGRRRRA